MLSDRAADDAARLAVRQSQLFLALAEELKLPFMQIARAAELGEMTQPAAESPLRDIQATADMSLQLLDSYVLSMRLSQSSDWQMSIEPVSVSAVLYDTMRKLTAVAGRYGVSLDLHVQARYEPVMVNRQALQSALLCLGYSLIEALPSAGTGNLRVQLATHRTKYGIVAGVYGELEDLTPRMYELARGLYGRSRQPFVGSMAGSGAGIFVADAILSAMASRLRVGRFKKMPGFAVTLPASEQLQLV